MSIKRLTLNAKDPDASSYCTPSNTKIISQSNKDLGAETSENFNLGIVLQPTDALTLKADFWQLEIDDVITRLPVGYMLNKEPQL